MQKSMSTSSARASGEGTPAVKLVHRASSVLSATRSHVVAIGVSVELLAGLAIPALVSLTVVGLIRVGIGCGPPL
ncbi:hypothetical protein BE11_34465 [Sorangium cellulosum]|nr:hypothetical protein BE11_34465 [Sorangium cellulosum]